MKSKPIFWISLVAVGAFTMAMAQRAPMSVEFSGSGSITRTGGPANRINRVEFELRRDRSAIVTFVGEKRWTYNGTWKNYAKDDYIIEIRRAYGDANASGTVQVSMNGDRVEALTIRDGRADNSRFSGSFKVSKYNNWTSNWGGLSTTGTARGYGSYAEPGQRARNFTQLTHAFNSNGEFDLALEGGGRIYGRYRRDTNDRLTLDIERAFGYSGASGGGTVQLTNDRRGVDSVRLNGSTRMGSFNVNWDRNGSGNGGWEDGNRPNNPFKLDTWGEGDGRSGNFSWSLTRTTGDFRKDGRFSMTVYSYDERIQVEGRWTDRDGGRGNRGRAENEDSGLGRGNRQGDGWANGWNTGQIVLDITKFRGRSASGTGTLDRSNSGQISRFAFAGTEGRNRFDFNFRGTGRRPNPR